MHRSDERRDHRDPRDLPNYGISEAARSLALPTSTVRVWATGLPYTTRNGDARRMKPLIRPAATSPLMLSFWNVVEVYVLASMRRHHAISMPRVRRALDFVSTRLDVGRPLLEEQFLTDGVDLFVDRYSELINVSARGQQAMRDVLKGSLRRIARDKAGGALSVYPWLREPAEPRFVELNPARAFGRLVIAETTIPTGALAERFRAGDSVDLLAEDYHLEKAQIEAALRWEQCGLAA